jgi:hypothetical protein
MYKKQCPTCGADQAYKSKITYTRGCKTNTECKACANTRSAIRDGSCTILLNESLATYYWLGFIFADGHIDKGNRLKVTLATKDIDHVHKLRIYLGKSTLTEQTSTHASISVMDTVSVKELCAKFGIESNKTEHPCSINGISGDMLTSVIIGFIDGDGSIVTQTGRSDCLLVVKCHSAWLGNLNYMTQHLTGQDKARITNAGYARFSLGQKHIIKLKEFAIANSLPIMERKWNKLKMED